MADNQSIIGRGAIFKGKISNASTIEINGRVDGEPYAARIPTTLWRQELDSEE